MNRSQCDGTHIHQHTITEKERKSRDAKKLSAMPWDEAFWGWQLSGPAIRWFRWFFTNYTFYFKQHTFIGWLNRRDANYRMRIYLIAFDARYRRYLRVLCSVLVYTQIIYAMMRFSTTVTRCSTAQRRDFNGNDELKIQCKFSSLTSAREKYIFLSASVKQPQLEQSFSSLLGSFRFCSVWTNYFIKLRGPMSEIEIERFPFIVVINFTFENF